jgi:hypothetical protein
MCVHSDRKRENPKDDDACSFSQQTKRKRRKVGKEARERE